MNVKKAANLNRRMFLKGSTAAVAAGAVVGLNPFASLSVRAANGQLPQMAALGEGGYGPLSPKQDLRDGVPRLQLPDGFSYLGFGFTGDRMTDGNLTPIAHDGMAALALPESCRGIIQDRVRARLRERGLGDLQLEPEIVRLVRNHEVRDDAQAARTIGLLGNSNRPFYDPIGVGGTTTLELQIFPDGSVELIQDFVSIQGTIVNCAGGPTPWGSWLTCEETTEGKGDGWEKPHGFVFEVPAAADGPVEAVPLVDMGRFSHEAVAVDPGTGYVYQTEDDGDSGFFRFIPKEPGNLAAGGELFMLKVKGQPKLRTEKGQTVGEVLFVEWVKIENPNPADADSTVFKEGRDKGGAIFNRLEGCWYGGGSIFFTSTDGGEAGEGQVWEFIPQGRDFGVLRLLFESPAESVLDNPDNITVSPRGGIVLCEDGDAERLFLRGLTRDGRLFDFAQNNIDDTEWAGATFSPDGKTLFVNKQGKTRGAGKPGDPPTGMTFAIWGPWEKGAL